MGGAMRTAFLIFMLLSGGAALFLNIMGLFPFGLLMILFFLLFFVLFVFSRRKTVSSSGKTATREQREKKEPMKNSARYMRFCSKCGYTGSQKLRDKVPACPVCGHSLLATDVSLQKYSAMTEEEREAVKKTWMLLG